MEQQYYTLQTIYNIVKEDAQPHTYLCNTREIIVRQLFGWDDIKTHLELLAMEQLITIRQLGSVAISITPAGLEKVKSLLRMTA
jgi:hypothetical protein